MQNSIKRSLLFSLDFANTGKLNFLENLWQEYQKACQYFVDVGYKTKTLPFKCLRCGYEEDADIVGARNVLLRFTRELIVPFACETSSCGIFFYKMRNYIYFYHANPCGVATGLRAGGREEEKWS